MQEADLRFNESDSELLKNYEKLQKQLQHGFVEKLHCNDLGM